MMRGLMIWLRWAMVIVSYLLLGLQGIFQHAEKSGSFWHLYFSQGIPLALVSAAVGLFLAYPLLVRFNRAIQPIHIRNQVKELIDLSKDASWDANDMGRRLAKLYTQNRINGERLIRGVIRAGFPSTVLEETATNEQETLFRSCVIRCREKDNEEFQLLMFIAPWIALALVYQLPIFWQAFQTWTWQGKAIFVGVVLFLYGGIPLEKVIELTKNK